MARRFAGIELRESIRRKNTLLKTRSLRHDNKIARQWNFQFQNSIVMTLPMKNRVLDNFPPCPPAHPPWKAQILFLLSSRFLWIINVQAICSNRLKPAIRNFLPPPKRKKKGFRSGNLEMIRENQAICAFLQIDSRELGHLSYSLSCRNSWGYRVSVECPPFAIRSHLLRFLRQCVCLAGWPQHLPAFWTWSCITLCPLSGCLIFGSHWQTSHLPPMIMVPNHKPRTALAAFPFLKRRKSTPKTTHPNKKSLRKQFSGLFVQTVLPLSFQLNKRHAERVWANCLRKLFSVGFIGVGGFLGWLFLPWFSTAQMRLFSLSKHKIYSLPKSQKIPMPQTMKLLLAFGLRSSVVANRTCWSSNWWLWAFQSASFATQSLRVASSLDLPPKKAVWSQGSLGCGFARPDFSSYKHVRMYWGGACEPLASPPWCSLMVCFFIQRLFGVIGLCFGATHTLWQLRGLISWRAWTPICGSCSCLWKSSGFVRKSGFLCPQHWGSDCPL